MRWKIIAVNAITMLLIGLGIFGLLMKSLSRVVSDPGARKQEVSRALRSANAQLALDASRLERWLAVNSGKDAIRSVFAAGTESARQDSASKQADELSGAISADPGLDKMAASLVLFADAQGVVLGKNGSALMRGEKLADIYPTLKSVLSKGLPTASEVWLNRERNEQLLVAYAAVRAEDGAVLGAVVAGMPLNDERMLRTSDLTSGLSLAAAVPGPKGLELVAHSSSASREVMASANSPEILAAAVAAQKTSSLSVSDAVINGYVYGASPIQGYGSTPLVLLAAVPVALVPDFLSSLGVPILGMTLLGLVLVVAGGFLLGNYISRPISELEDGLLAIMNGNSDLRFQIEHAELGGLVFRINSLLNTLMGVAEDDTDEQGRPSQAPSSKAFSEALSVDESSALAQQTDPQVAAALAAEAPAQYYARLHQEYVAAKRQLGDPVEHITFDAFVAKIRASEQQMTQKHGRPVRFQVTLRDSSVVLVAVILPG
ncbi:MAG: MXAN_5187 C-terminal domain-containing protein [Polyangiaceae bacterium]|nr:MXAN_5187 C-terminal domain-containing protein [Polyangiaceae bacterium]